MPRRDQIRCIVCDNNKLREGTVTYHSFPKDEVLRKAWVNFCILSDCVVREDDNTNRIKICSDHFLDSDYNFDLSHKRLRLKKGAVPCRLGQPSSLLEIDHSDWAPTRCLGDSASEPAVDESVKQDDISEQKPTLSEQLAELSCPEASETRAASPSPRPPSPQILPENDTKDIKLPANMVQDRLGKIWLTNDNGKVETERDGVVLIVDPREMTVTARVVSRF